MISLARGNSNSLLKQRKAEVRPLGSFERADDTMI
jgi:hypothetical protein